MNASKQTPFKKLKFRYPWRDYQERVLHELDGHLDDDHLHVVAAPGSGKTILGLEVMRRLGQPSIILAPTITIRNQWIERLTSMFFTEDVTEPEWISKNIRKPQYLTVITYQALHAAFSGEQEDQEENRIIEEESIKKTKSKKSEKTDVISLLMKQRVSTIVLDEAHHLRKEWWKALTDLKAGLKKTTIVSLTATPPYDVEYKEWQRYEQLCGPIDTEISVPELVKSGDLCPHQDYVYFSLPTQKEAAKLEQFKTDVKLWLERLKSDQDVLRIVSAHSWVSDTENHIEDILSEPQIFSSIIIFLNACGIKPSGCILKVLGTGNALIPELDAKWLEIFLTGLLYTHTEQFAVEEEKLDVLRKELKRIGAIERRRVIIDNTKDIQKMLAGSAGKLESIIKITRAEAGHLGDNLRMVVLADYIRKTELPKNAEDLRPVDKIGVIPIFEILRRARIQNVRLGVLTGSIIFIPVQARSLLEELAKNMNIPASHVSYGAVVHDENFVRIEIKGEQRQKIVHLITEVFNAGGITVLVGTQALLGEGWDAPSVNTLILASYVGSYMLSNQMRGRAIRIDPDVPNKVANVWHLVALDIETMQEKIRHWFRGETERNKHFDPFDEIKEDLGSDVQKLRRRFRAFEGLSYSEPFIIENGFKRLGLSKVQWNERSVKKLNEDMIGRARARERLAEIWKQALTGSSPRPEMREKVEANTAPTGLAFIDTLKYMVINALIGGAAWGVQVFSKNSRHELSVLLMIGLGMAAVYAIPKLLKALYLWVRNGTLENSMKQVGRAVLESLQDMDLMETSPGNLRIETVKDKMGVVYCRLEGATTIERRHFYEAMLEILGPVDNPRYLLVRQSYPGRLLQVDYHAVPEVLGQNKKNAEFFTKNWIRHVGTAELVYARSIEGRKILLKARTRALSSAFQKKTDRTSIWE